jgi:acyl-CoA thioesterase
VDELERFVEQDAFARYLGIEMLTYGDGRAVTRLAVKAHHLNSAGCLHGGALFSLADAAFSAAANSQGALALSIDANISYFEAVTGGTLTAEAREVARNAKLATYLIDIRDEAGGLVAHFRGTVYRKRAGIGDVLGP